MPSTTHLMSIKCGDSVYPLSGAARQNAEGPIWHRYDPCPFYFVKRGSRCLELFKQSFPSHVCVYEYIINVDICV